MCLCPFLRVSDVLTVASLCRGIVGGLVLASHRWVLRTGAKMSFGGHFTPGVPSHWLGPSLPTILFMISQFKILLGTECLFEHCISSPG